MSTSVYGLMDVETANMVGWYSTVPDALAAVWETIRRYGRQSAAVQSLALAREDDDSDGPIASGDELAEMATRYAATLQR